MSESVTITMTPFVLLFVVDAGGTTATDMVQGFTGKLIEKNCHAGARDNLLNAWSGRPGRDADSVARE